MPTESRFRLNISAEQIEKYYRGNIQYVQVTDQRGLVVRFPISRIRPFLAHDGVAGEFVLHYDDENRIVSLEKIAD